MRLPGSPLPATTALCDKNLRGLEFLNRSRKRRASKVEMAFTTGTSFLSTDPSASRALSAVEFSFGAFIVIGHNVFHIVPNEVMLLSVLGFISIRLRDGNWSAMGLKRPALWRRILLIALVAAALSIWSGRLPLLAKRSRIADIS
jgi:hypothetical protein